MLGSEFKCSVEYTLQAQLGFITRSPTFSQCTCSLEIRVDELMVQCIRAVIRNLHQHVLIWNLQLVSS